MTASNGDACEWRQIPGFSAYEISEEGLLRRRVRSHRYAAGTPVRPHLIDGYWTVKVVGDDRRRTQTGIHRLVALAFIGPPPTKQHVAAHNDGDRLCNHRTNLRWATVAENNADMSTHGTLRSGERHHSARLNAERVREIRARYTGQFGQLTALAREFGITRASMRKVILGQSWRAQ